MPEPLSHDEVMEMLTSASRTMSLSYEEAIQFYCKCRGFDQTERQLSAALYELQLAREIVAHSRERRQAQARELALLRPVAVASKAFMDGDEDGARLADLFRQLCASGWQPPREGEERTPK